VGLFQLGEILISKEILSEEKVYEILCEHWLREHPGKELPENARIQILVEEDSDYGFESTSSIEVVKIQDSEGKSGYKVCEICGSENSLTANFCHGCSERLTKYTLKVKTDIGNKTVFKKTIIENDVGVQSTTDVYCAACGFRNPISAEICFNCLEPLNNPEKIEDSTEYADKNDLSDAKFAKKNIDNKELTELLKTQSNDDFNNIEAPHFLIEDKKMAIIDENVVNQLENSEQGNIGDTLTYDSIIYDPSSSKLFIPTNFDLITQRRCPKCGYINSNVLPFCFGCYTVFEDVDINEQPNISIQED